MQRAEFLDYLRFRLAEIAIGPSALRKRGAPGVIAAARSFLKVLDLTYFVTPEESEFQSRLDLATVSMQKGLPTDAQHWGAARKAMNLFLRDALYCQDVASHYGLQTIRGYLEVPLDHQVAKGLRRCYPHLTRGLPKWKGIKHLSPAASNAYQQAAAAVAEQEGLARVDLDVILWRATSLRPALSGQ